MPTFPLGPRDRAPTPTGQPRPRLSQRQGPGVRRHHAQRRPRRRRGRGARARARARRHGAQLHPGGRELLAAAPARGRSPPAPVFPGPRCTSPGRCHSVWPMSRSSSRDACCGAIPRFHSKRPGCRRRGWRSTTPGPARSSAMRRDRPRRPWPTRPGGSSTTATSKRPDAPGSRSGPAPERAGWAANAHLAALTPALFAAQAGL